jgi:predicted MFS family arabinose efflux permease
VSTHSGPRRSLQLAVLTTSRLFLNTGLRMVYPFLPAFSRGLGVPLSTLAILVSLRSASGVFSPLFTPLSERHGRRPVLAVSLALFAAGCTALLLWPSLPVFGLMLIFVAVAKVIYDPAMQAYIGDTVVYRERGRALAITELSWAGAFLLGVPLLGWTIENHGWRAPFLFLAVFGVAAAVALWRFLPASDGRGHAVTDLRQTWKVIRHHRVIWVAAAYILLVMLANELVLIVYGDWMETSFGLTLTRLGLATAVIGGSEITGELSTAVFIDRVGKRTFVIVTGFLTVVLYAALPLAGATLTLSLMALFLLFLFFEMTVVGGVPLMTEIVPAARSVVMSVVLASAGLGRALGALIGPAIWSAYGFGLLLVISAALMLAAVVILASSIHEAAPHRP